MQPTADRRVAATSGEPLGSTPLDPDEAQGLIPSWIATYDNLNEAEQANILRSHRRRRWAHPTTADVLDDRTARDLHRAMFGDVWKWAGLYRNTEKNIGVDPREISVRVRNLMADAAAWLSESNPLPVDQAAYELHHKLVLIHPFPNGNGRHARRVADLLLTSLEQSPFSWGSSNLNTDGDVRRTYISALKAADGGDYGPLADFVRS